MGRLIAKCTLWARTQTRVNSTERVIKFRIVASFDTVQALARGTLAGDIKCKVCTNWTFRRRQAQRLKKETRRWAERQREANCHSSSGRTTTPPFPCARTFIKLGRGQRVVDATCANNAGGGRGKTKRGMRDKGDSLSNDDY